MSGLSARNAPTWPVFGFQRGHSPCCSSNCIVSGGMCDRTKLLAIFAGAAGGAVAIAGMEAFSARAVFPLVAIPFATSIVIVLGSPKAEPAQPRALIGGHLVSTFVGLLIVKLLGPAPWAAALAAGCVLGAMHMCGTLSPSGPMRTLVV